MISTNHNIRCYITNQKLSYISFITSHGYMTHIKNNELNKFYKNLKPFLISGWTSSS